MRGEEKRRERRNERVGSDDSHELDLIGHRLEDRESDFVTPAK